jgi:hypothetical protein
VNTISKKLADLKLGEAIHVGHSYVILNIAGIKIALDSSTDDGYCISPFANLSLYGKSQLKHLSPIPDIKNCVPTAKDLAQNINIFLFSHLHPDHFNRTLLEKILDINQDIKVICPRGTNSVLAYKPKPTKIAIIILETLQKLNIATDQVNGMLEYLNSTDDASIPSQHYIELDHGEANILSRNPLVKIDAFELRHPKPQFYFRLPFESKELPPTLGYLITYEEDGKQKKIMLVGESGNDPELLWQLWNNREELIAVFVPVADESTTKGFKWFKDAYMHASLLIIALAEQLTTSKASIHTLHQGLWYYVMNEDRIYTARKMLSSEKMATMSFQELESIMLESRKHRGLSIKSYLMFRKLIKAIGGLSLDSSGVAKLSTVGTIFKYGNK